MRKHILQAHRILMRIESENAYSNIAFYDEDVNDMATLLVYGVLENNIRTEYIINSLVDKKPQRSIHILLKIGAYALENLSDVPQFAIVSECVESAKALGKSGAGGFVNAVLKKIANGSYALPAETDSAYLSVKFSKPQWFIDKLSKQYGYDKMIEIISAKSQRLEHIRVNSRVTDIKAVADMLNEAGESYTLSDVGGLVVRGTKTVKHLFDEGLITFQSASSMLAVKALNINSSDRVLDICSAPGGKAIFASEFCKDGEVIACELHPHRIKLIEKYIKRMGVSNVKPHQSDATVINSEWINSFDCVLADVPCSCFGTFLKHPDVFMTRGEREIYTLSVVQRKILGNAARYVKKGGSLVYSTCTLFDEENFNVVNGLLSKGEFELCPIDALNDIDNGNYKNNNGSVQILPHGEYDGFYIAKLRKL